MPKDLICTICGYGVGVHPSKLRGCRVSVQGNQIAKRGVYNRYGSAMGRFVRREVKETIDVATCGDNGD